MIFIDSNIPMYLVGAAHPHKADSQRLLDNVSPHGSASSQMRRSSRRSCIGTQPSRRDAIQPAFDALHAVVDAVFPVELADVERAKSNLLGSPQLSARDALHLAVMQRHRVARILSFDGDFDDIPGIERLAV